MAGERGDLPEGITFHHTDRGDSHKLVAMHPEDGHVGQLTWFKKASPGNHRAGEVDGLEVHPDYQRRGVATALWQQAHSSGLRPKPRHSSELTSDGAEWMKSVGQKFAYGETKAPADVDTLRDEACPVCGESSMSYNGNQCQVCGFVQPPKQFQDPDLDMAKKMDLRKDEDDLAPGGMGDFEDDVNDADRDGFDDKTGLPVDGEQEGMLDEQPLLTCNVCGEQFPAAEPKTVDTLDPQAGALGGEDPNEDPMMAETEGQAVEGDPCPACGQGELLGGAEEEEAEQEGLMPMDEESEEDPEDPEQDEDFEEEPPFPGGDDGDPDEEDEESEEDEDDPRDPAKRKPSPFK